MLLGYKEGVEVPEAGLNVPGPPLTSSEAYLHLASAHLLVGISSKPISKKICRNSARTLFTGIPMISYSSYKEERPVYMVPYRDAMLRS